MLGALGAFSGCNGCGADKPYTPFGVASTLSSATAELPPPAVPDAGLSPTPAPSVSSGFAVRKAELVPGAPRAWQGANLSLITPAALGFAQVLPADYDGDGKTDAIAWLVPDKTEKDTPPGELWYFPNGAPPRKLSGLPGFVPSSPDCPLTATLNQTGPHSATLDVTATCQSALIARSPCLLYTSPSPRD